MRKDIKFIYLDVGGVVVFDFSKNDEKWVSLMDSLGVSAAERGVFKDIYSRYEPEMCAGRKTSGDFLEELGKNIQISVQKDHDLIGEFVNRFERNKSIADFIEDISDTFKFGLLTNMFPGMFERIKEGNLLPDIDWQVIVDSSVVGVEKPEEGIYSFAQESIEATPESILFVDNVEENVLAAQNIGWSAILYDPLDVRGSNTRIEEFLQQ